AKPLTYNDVSPSTLSYIETGLGVAEGDLEDKEVPTVLVAGKSLEKLSSMVNESTPGAGGVGVTLLATLLTSDSTCRNSFGVRTLRKLWVSPLNPRPSSSMPLHR